MTREIFLDFYILTPLEVGDIVEPQASQSSSGGSGGAVSWNSVTGKPTTFPPSSHQHSIGQVIGLFNVLQAKADLDESGKVQAEQLPTSSSPVTSVNEETGDVIITKAMLGLDQVDDTSDANKPISNAQQTAIDNKVDKVTGKQLSTNDYTTLEKDKLSALPGTAYSKSESDTQLAAKADLVGGFVPSSQLPSYVDDILNYTNLAAFPATGELGKIYIANDTGKQYRWTGSAYIAITNGLIGSTDDVPEGTRLYFTTARVLAVVMSGLSLISTSAVVDTDTLIIAIGKLQAQISANLSSITSTLSNKVDKVTGKGLSTEDYTTTEKSKLATLPANAYSKSESDTQLAAKADLVGGFVPSSQLPSYVDDILNYTNLAAFPATGELGKIYIANDTGKQYRWTGSAYIAITNGLIGSTDDVPEGTRLYFTTARVLAVVMSGLSLISTSAVVDTDTLIIAIGKLQAQISANLSSITSSLSNKVDKVTGKGLSTEDYTTTEKSKLATLPANAYSKSESDTQLAAKADLVGGFVPSSQLPSYVDDILNYTNLSAFPATGELGKIYIANDTGKQYRWTGSAYIAITNGLIGSTADVPEGANLYFTEARVLAAILAGLSTSTSAVITSSDSVLSALGKIQAQLSGIKSYENIQASALTGITFNAGVVRYYPVKGILTVNTITAGASAAILFTKGGVTKNCAIRTGSAQPGTGSQVYILQTGATIAALADTSIVITIAAGSAAGDFTSANTVTFNDNTWMVWREVNNASAASATLMSTSALIEH
jgi:hypothetical protein